MNKLLRGFLLTALGLLLVALTIWATGAIYFVFPIASLRAPLAVGYVLAATAIALLVRSRWCAAAFIFAGFCLVLAWWLTIQPSNDRVWRPDVSRTAFAKLGGDNVILHNIRNCDYRTENDFTPHWEQRSVKLSQLTGMNCFLIYWGSPWIAHTIISFDFSDAPPIAFSIETRMEMGEKYSAIAGFFRRYELIYVVADERDVIRVRTNYRKGEDVYLFHLKVSPMRAREIFLDYLRSLNDLNQRPEFYNALTSNCTTNVRVHVAATAHSPARPWDWRILLSGKIDEYAYEIGALDRRLPLAELKSRSLINPVAQKMGDNPAFSQRIRAGRPGF